MRQVMSDLIADLKYVIDLSISPFVETAAGLSWVK